MSMLRRSLMIGMIAFACSVTSVGCGSSADSSPNPALGEPGKDGPPKRNMPSPTAGEKKSKKDKDKEKAKETTTPDK